MSLSHFPVPALAPCPLKCPLHPTAIKSLFSKSLLSPGVVGHILLGTTCHQGAEGRGGFAGRVQPHQKPPLPHSCSRDQSQLRPWPPVPAWGVTVSCHAAAVPGHGPHWSGPWTTGWWPSLTSSPWTGWQWLGRVWPWSLSLVQTLPSELSPHHGLIWKSYQSTLAVTPIPALPSGLLAPGSPALPATLTVPLVPPRGGTTAC